MSGKASYFSDKTAKSDKNDEIKENEENKANGVSLKDSKNSKNRENVEKQSKTSEVGSKPGKPLKNSSKTGKTDNGSEDYDELDEKQGKKHDLTRLWLVLIPIVATIVAVTIVVSAALYVSHVTSSRPAVNKAADTTLGQEIAVGGNSLPDKPQASAIKFMTNLMDDTAKRYPIELFTKDNPTVQAFLKGDSNSIPENVKSRMYFGDSRIGMKLGRENLNSLGYLGLIMFSQGYKQTTKMRFQLLGENVVSFNTKTGDAYVPLAAIVVSDQNFIFHLHWTGKTWILDGDMLGWQTYVMLQNQANQLELKALQLQKAKGYNDIHTK